MEYSNRAKKISTRLKRVVIWGSGGSSQVIARIRRQCGRFVASLITVTLLGTVLGDKADASTIQTAVVPCADCASAGDLLAVATSYFAQFSGTTPPGYTGTINPSSTPLCTASGAMNGTNVLVISAAVPISEFFYECLQHSGTGINGTFTLVVKPADTGANADSIANDALLISRSAKTGPITLPSDFSLTGSTDEEMSAYLSSAAGIPQNGTSTISLWHGITNFPQVLQGTFVNVQTGEAFTLWNGDTITVTDSNGNTAKFQWTPLSTIQWRLVPNSVRNAAGNPPGATPMAAGADGSSVTVTLPNGNTTIITPFQAPDGDPPLPKGTVILEPDPFGTGGTAIVIVGCENSGPCADIPNR